MLGFAILSAAGIGLMAAEDVMASVGLLLAIAAGVSILLRPMVGLFLLLVLAGVENAVLFGEGLSGARAVGMVVFGAWVLRKIALRESWRPVVRSGLFALGLSFGALILLSALWAINPLTVRAGFMRVLQMLVLALLVIDIVRTWERIDILAKALIVGASIAAFLTIYQSVVLGDRRAGDEIAGGVNATAMLLLTVMPFGFYLLRSRQNLIWRFLGVGYIAAAAAAINLTFSRFNLLLLPIVLFALLVLTWRDRVNRGMLVTVVSVGVAALILIVPWGKVAERGQTIGPYIVQTLGGDPTAIASSPRGFHLKVGLEIARDHPVLGVGYNNYGEMFFQQYQFSVSGRDRLYRSNRSPHSSYVGILADLGIVGLSLWLAILVLPLRKAMAAWRNSRAAPLSRAHLLAQSLTLAMALHVFAYPLYMSNQNEKVLWVIIGMCMAAGWISKKAPGSSAPTETGAAQA